MQSDRWHDFTRTFQFRLAINHVLLVSGALAATFVTILLMARSSAMSDGRKYIGSVIRQAQSAYLGDTPSEETEQLPEAILDKIETDFPNLRIGLVERETQPGGFLYEVTGSTGDEQLEILAETSGRIGIADRKSINEIFDLMSMSVGETVEIAVELFVYSPEGDLLIATPSAQLPIRTLEAIRREMEIGGEPFIERIGSAWVGGATLYDGNVLCVVSHMDDVHRISRRVIEFFILMLVFFVPLSGWIGFHISRKAVAGIKRVTAAAGAVEAGNFRERVAAGSEESEIEDLEAAFNDMVERIELLMRELRDVTVNIAHDLKTPITRIRGLLESINWVEVTPEEREQIVGTALEECDQIAPLIDSVLELAQAEAGMLVLQKEPFDLAKEVRNAHAVFSSLAEDRGIQFDCIVPNEAVGMVGDRFRMQRVIANLIDNAIKFSPENGAVSVALESDGEQAVIKVQDNGPGISPADSERVFERFYRVDRTRNTPGHGLGLSLVKTFVKAFGGTVEINSKEGLGCTVSVRIPFFTA